MGNQNMAIRAPCFMGILVRVVTTKQSVGLSLPAGNSAYEKQKGKRKIITPPHHHR